MKRIKNDIQNNQFENSYLLYGEENFLKKYYVEQMIKKMIPKESQMMNLEIFDGKQISANQIIDTAETLPFLSEKRLVIVRDSELFKTGRSDESNKLAEFLPGIPKTTYIVFVENDIDRRSRLYKAVHKYGYAAEFSHPREGELITWVKNNFKKHEKELSAQAAIHLLRTVGSDMETLSGEIDKLIAFKTDMVPIVEEDIDEICTKSIETKIFELVNAMGYKQPEKALEIYKNLILFKESPIMILTMIARQFRIILQTKYLQQQGMDQNTIAKRVGLRSFIVRDSLKQASYFSLSVLQKALEECLETDVAIKSGQIDGNLAVEMILIKYSHTT